MRRWWLAVGLLAALGPGRAEALSISLSTATPVIALGQVAFVDVLVSDLPEGQALRAFDLDVLFDAPPLGYDSLAFDGLLGAPGAEASTSGGAVGAGAVDLAENSFLAGDALLARQPETFRLARIGLRGVALGTAALAIGPAELIGLGAAELPLAASSGLSIEVVVPEPGVAGMLALGLAALAQRRRAVGARPR